MSIPELGIIDAKSLLAVYLICDGANSVIFLEFLR